MGAIYLVALIAAAAVFVYLVAVLFFPEDLS